jgi:nicotinamide phosphoribosyltransferase
MKKSAKGLLRVEKEGDDFVLYDCQTKEQEAQGALVEVFRDSQLKRFETIVEIRSRLGW